MIGSYTQPYFSVHLKNAVPLAIISKQVALQVLLSPSQQLGSPWAHPISSPPTIPQRSTAMGGILELEPEEVEKVDI